jgi:hypothetical protein
LHLSDLKIDLKDWRADIAYYKSKKTFNERPGLVKSVFFSMLVLLFVMRAGFCDESEKQPVDPSRLNGNTLSLPEIGGSISAPPGQWEWFLSGVESENSRNYLCYGPGLNFFSLELIAVRKDTRTAKPENFRKHLNEIALSMGGAEILSDTGVHISLPNHPYVFHLTSRIRIADLELSIERYVMNAGSHTALFTFADTGNANLIEREAIISSLNYKPIIAPNTFRDMIYCFWALIVCGTAWLINTVTRRRLIPPPIAGILGICVLLIYRLSLLDYLGRHLGFYMSYEIGLTIVPLAILLYICYRNARAAKAVCSVIKHEDATSAETISDSGPSDAASQSESSTRRR